jgi:hypothetical protein
VTTGRTPPPTRATVEGRAYLDLRALAKTAGRASEEYLRLYALEGFLLRLAASANSADFVLKGGVLLAAYQLSGQNRKFVGGLVRSRPWGRRGRGRRRSRGRLRGCR